MRRFDEASAATVQHGSERIQARYFQSRGGPELNLITCYPFFYVGSAPKRFVVEARLAGAVSRAS